MQKVKDVFKTGERVYVYESFSDRFNDELLGETNKTLSVFTLPEKMLDTEILEKINNKYCTFADIYQAIQDEKQLLKNGDINIFYVKTGNRVFAVAVRWYSDLREWSVDDWKLDEGGRWLTGAQVLCPGNALDTLSLESLEKRVAKLEKLIIKKK